MRYGKTAYHRFEEEEVARANSVDILMLARKYGYEPEKAGRKAVHMKRSGGLYIFPESNRFFQWMGADGGEKGGAIDFVMREEGLPFPEAVAKLLGVDYSPLTREVKPYVPEERKPLKLPEPAKNFKRAYWYLVAVRGIDPQIVSVFMKRRQILQEAKYGNTVFVGYDTDGTPKYCAMRASRPDSSFKMDAENSDKSFPFFHEGKSQLLIVNESPIDMMSHATLTKLHKGDWQRDHRISLGCLWDGALERYLSWHPEIRRIVFGYGNDYLARNRNGQLTNWGQLAAGKHVQKYTQKGYECAIHTPHLKDFNMQLTETRNGRTIQEMDAQRMKELEEEFEKDAANEPAEEGGEGLEL